MKVVSFKWRHRAGLHLLLPMMLFASAPALAQEHSPDQALDVLAAEGSALVAADPKAKALRSQLPDDATRRSFDIAAAFYLRRVASTGLAATDSIEARRADASRAVPEQENRLNSVRVQQLTSDRAIAASTAAGVVAKVGESQQSVVGNLGSDGSGTQTDSQVAEQAVDATAIAADKRIKVDPPICAFARSARARNSPAAAGLAKQCREAGGSL